MPQYVRVHIGKLCFENGTSTHTSARVMKDFVLKDFDIVPSLPYSIIIDCYKYGSSVIIKNGFQ